MKVKRLKAEEITTLGIDGIHEVFFPESIKELEEVTEGGDFFVLGGGSNVVIPENCKKRLVSLKFFNNGIKISKGFLTAGAGVELKKVLKEQVRKGFSLFEQLAGIPKATVGGLVAQNAGAYGFEIKDRLVEVVFWDWKEKKVKTLNSFNSFGYRKSPFPSSGIVLEATFKIEKDEKVKEKIEFFTKQRLKAQPPFYLKTAGSTFKNPPPPLPPAGKLLDEAGFKGFKVGRLKFSEKHANFLINLGGARFSEFEEIVKRAREKVEKIFGIKLELEIKIPCK